MIKRLFTLAIVALAAVCSQASNWQVIPTFVGSSTQNVVDTGDKVYYLASNCLFCYDKSTKETESLNRANYLNDVAISAIYYNNYKDYLMIVYANSNIDVITEEGKIINLPDIYNASLTTSKTVNDVTFSAKGRAYVATAFGYVVFNDAKWEVKESHIFKENVVSVAEMGNYVILSRGSELRYGLIDKHYETIGSMPLVSTTFPNDNGRLYPLTDSRMLILTGWVYGGTVGTSGDVVSFTADIAEGATCSNVQQTPSGFILNCFANNCYYTLNNEGKELKKVEGGKQMYSSYADGDGTLWCVGEKGLRHSTDSTYIKPAALSMAVPYNLAYNEAQKLLYVTSTGTNHFISEQFYPTAVNTYDGITVTDITPPALELEPGTGKDGTGTYYPAFPVGGEGSTYYLGSWWSGIFKVVNGKITYNYNWDNSPLQHLLGGYYCHATIGIDRKGNLWASQTGASADNALFVLPQAKLSQATTTKDDWITVNVADFKSSKRSHFLPLTNSSIKVYSSGEFNGFVSFINDSDVPKANPTSRSYNSGSLYDQDGNLVEWNYVYSLCEDANGTLWMGTNNGIVTCTPTEAFGSGFKLSRIKVPRNDGTSLADYLLNGLAVTAITTDAANRKWIGTQSSGLFQVSSDGTTILNQFNTSNSPLLSDYIYNICCDPNTGSVYVTTANGMMEYKSSSVPATNDYSNIYAYPNPVRPDYYGLITITGIMDNSLIKITDSNGNVVKSLKSTGGEVKWDGAAENGERVKSGVYFVFASQAGEGTESAVTKILIVR